MDQKLAEYRAKKAREAKINELKSKAKHLITSFVRKTEPNDANPTAKLQIDPKDHNSPPDLSDDDDASMVSEDVVDDSISCFSFTDLLYYFMWFAFWATLYVIFIQWQFGTVYLIVSAIIFMYINTRTGPRKSREVSAYSVFNKNCESIDGTLKAEQFEREIRYGAGTVR